MYVARSERAARSEQGQVIVMVALLLPVIFALGAIVIDIGNFYIHKRHLQTQVDASALASGPEFTWCFLDPTAADVQIKEYALRYAGDTRRDPDEGDPQLEHNRQLQEPTDVFAVLNSSSYWPPPPPPLGPADPTVPGSNGYGFDETLDGDPSTPTTDSSKPCDARFLDVKATDDAAPMLWGLLPFSPSPKAKARVEIRRLRGQMGFLPWAVPENAPETVAALFVNEASSNTVAAWTYLNRPTSTTTVNGEAANVWSGAGQVNIVEENGVIVLQSRDALTDADLAPGGTPLSLTAMCSLPGTTCFGRVANQNPQVTNRTGVGFVFGEHGTPGPNVAAVREAELTHFDHGSGLFGPGNPSCLGQDTSPYFVWESFGDCQIRIRARIDFGSNLAVTPRAVHVQRNGTFGGNCNGGTASLTLRDGWWESPWITLPESSGRNEFRLCWRAGNGKQRLDGNFSNQIIQTAFSANTDSRASNTAYSGPIVSLTIGDHSQPQAAQTVSVDVGLTPPLRVSGPTDPAIYLRVAGRGSLNQMLDCDPPSRGPDEEIRDGCQTPYAVNERLLSCGPPAPTWDRNNLPPTMSPDDPAWIDPDCIEANPGDVTSMSKGLRARFEDPEPTGANCPPNRWALYRSTGTLPTSADKRLITLIIANYGEFDDQGIKPLPITKFAAFYVTGWFVGGGQQGTAGCASNDPPPSPPYCPRRSTTPCDADDTEVQGAVWGHFVVQVDPPARGRPGPELCDFAALDKCIAVLVE